MNIQKIVHILYRKLLSLYPQTFRDQLAESMEQTFKDLYNERRQSKKGISGLVLWTFIETAIGIFREHLLLVSPGDIMQAVLKTFGSSALLSLILILPFTIMEIVNRRTYNEDFPFALFFALWLNLFAVIIILLPILRARRIENHDMAYADKNALIANPKSTLLISILLFVAPGIFPLLNFLGWVNLDRLFNGPNPEVLYLPGIFLTIGLIFFPISAGVVAGKPIVNTLRAGGTLFAYPIHLTIVVILSFLFVAGAVSLIVDQWPCFIGIQFCD